MSDFEPTQVSALQLAARIAARQLSPVEAVESHIRRIEEVNPSINALVADRFDAARAEVRAMELLLKRGAVQPGAGHSSAGRARDSSAVRPLLGVPFSVKEMIAVRGMPATFGCGNRRGRIANADATAVARLRAAGATVLGVTNVPEWGMWFETFNSVYGRTSNPYNVACTPGGSSGGEGAIVAAGGSAFGLGTDIGGSVRMPAAFCGVYGHKPSAGLVPLTGAYPVYADGPGAPVTKAASYLTIAPLARSARDLHLLLRVMAGDDGTDPNARDVVLKGIDDIAWQGRTVLLLPDPRIRLVRSTSQPLQDAVRAAGRVFESRGARVSEAPSDLLQDAADAWFASLQSVGGPSFAEILGDGVRVSLAREVTATMIGRGSYSWPALYFLAGEKIGRKSERSLRRALQQRQRLADRLTNLLGDDGIILSPVHPRVAPRHNTAVLHPFDFLCTAAFNALGMPATSAPAGFDSDGMPLAVQIAARDGGDHLTIAAASVLEDEWGAWTPAPTAEGAPKVSLHDPAR